MGGAHAYSCVRVSICVYGRGHVRAFVDSREILFFERCVELHQLRFHEIHIIGLLLTSTPCTDHGYKKIQYKAISVAPIISFSNRSTIDVE